MPPRRGQQIHYFKTGIGFGPDLKPLSQLIEENKHEDSIIEYLKAILHYIFLTKVEIRFAFSSLM